MTQHRRARPGATSCRVSSRRCLGGPWHGQRRVLSTAETSLAVPGVAGFRYVRRETVSGEAILAWSNDETRW